MSGESGPRAQSPEEIAKNQTSRTLSDARLIKFGAEYVPNDDGEPRLEITKQQLDSFKEEMDNDINKKIERENEPSRQEVIKRDETIDFKKIIESNSELKDKVECIVLEEENKLFVIKIKEFPTIGIIVSEVYQGGDQTRLHFNYIDDGAPARTVYKEVVSPVPGDLVRNKDGTKILKQFEDNSENSEYFEKAKEIVSMLEKICAENGITALAIRQGNAWADWKLPVPKDIEILDARYETVFTDKLGMPEYEYDVPSSKNLGYDAKKPYPTFDWYREN